MKYNDDQNFRTVRGYQIENRQSQTLTPALEDYLEMAYRLCQHEGYTRINRLSEKLNVKPSSASKMVLRLVRLGYLQYDAFDSIQLTEKGQKKGAYLLGRHDTVEEFLTFIASSNPLQEAELAEHTFSPLTVKHLSLLLEFFAANPQIAEQYRQFCRDRQE